jgi:hypothetical protein
MNLSDATAEFARQLVIALAGEVVDGPKPEDLLDPENINAEVRLRDERDARLRAELERDKLRGAVQEVLRQEGDLLSADRALVLRDALGEPVRLRWHISGRCSHAEALQAHGDPELVDELRQRVRAAKNQRDELLRAVRASILSRADRTAEDAALRNIVDRVERERRSG